MNFQSAWRLAAVFSLPILMFAFFQNFMPKQDPHGAQCSPAKAAKQDASYVGCDQKPMAAAHGMSPTSH